MRSILTVTPADYWAHWHAFDDNARLLDLTPVDRSMAWRQYTSAMTPDLYEWPVPYSHFVSDPFYGGHLNVREALRQFGEDFTSPSSIAQLFIFIGGFGVGKSHSASVLLTYVAYTLSCVRRREHGGPGAHRYLSQFPGVDLDATTDIALSNVSAAGKTQGKKVVFGQVASMIEASPYFLQHFHPDATTEQLVFPGGLRAAVGTSQARSVLGLNIYFYVIDEAAFAISDSEEVNTGSVKAQFEQLNGRLHSRFGQMGAGGLYSSPKSESAYVELLAGETTGEVMVRRMNTWEAKGELKPGAEIFLFDRNPERPRIVDAGPLIYVKPGLAQNPETGELVRFGPAQPSPDERAREALRKQAGKHMTAGGGVRP